jgi:FMN phosphatase YigB (HAD superfamily)
MKSLIVFLDFGGTLIDSPNLFETITYNLTNKRSDEKTHDLVLETFMKIFQNLKVNNSFLSLEDMIAKTLEVLAQEYGYPDISNRVHDIYYHVFLHETNLFPETLSVLDTLQKNNVRMVIASDVDVEIMEEAISKHNLKKYFIDVCTSGLVKAYKPSDQFVSYLKKYTSNNEERCYFVGDGKVDVISGNILGINSVFIDRKNLGYTVNADYIIRDLTELLPILNLK